MRTKLIGGLQSGEAYTRSAKFAGQAIENIRTVASLGRLDAFVDDYLQTLAIPTKVLFLGGGRGGEDTL